MKAYNHVCEDCGKCWEAGHSSQAKADNAKCPSCGSPSTQANEQG